MTTQHIRDQSRVRGKRRQEESLRSNEQELARHVANQREEEFFKQIIPFLKPLRAYIARWLRVAYLDGEIRTPVATSSDILNDVVLNAYRQYGNKPKDLNLEEWLYRLANDELERYVRERGSIDSRRQSLETLTSKELRTLDELNELTADAEGEPWLAEELDDAEYDLGEFGPPSNLGTPEQQLEKKELLLEVIRGLSRLPQRDRMVFELYCVEGFPKDRVAKILGLDPDEVPRIAESARKAVLQQIHAASR